TQDHEAQLYQDGSASRVVKRIPANFLRAGTNVLCIQAHNRSSNSSDLSIIPYLSLVYEAATTEGRPPPPELKLHSRYMHTNFSISAQGERLYLYRADGSLADSLDLPPQQSGISYGLTPDGWRYFATPTPGQPNTGETYAGIVSTPIQFSHPGGPAGPLSLELSGISPQEHIRYTLDASLPGPHSALYEGPLTIDQPTVLRARVFRPGYLPSPVQTRTFLPGISHSMPVITLVSEPANFFDPDSGIMVRGHEYQPDFPYFGANFWQDWERPIHFAFYEEDGSNYLAFDGGVKIFGGWSRAMDQRSLSIFARRRYGTPDIDYPLFPDRPYTHFQALVLRNSGNDWLNTMMRDATLTSLMKGSGLDYQAYRPAVTYLNGQYWGFYNMREKINEHFLAAKHDLDPASLHIAEQNGKRIYGDNQDYLDLINFISATSLAQQHNYEQVAAQIDIDNYIMYQLAQVYFDNTDWPGNNIKFWKADGGKWRWILFDTDFGFGIWDNSKFLNNTLAFALEANGEGWPNPPWSTLLFRKLMENENFRHKFVNQFADELNTRFLPGRVGAHIDSMAAGIVAEIPAHYQRWGGSVEYWASQVENMKRFANLRAQRVKYHIMGQFGLPAFHSLRIENPHPEQGYVRLNSLNIRQESWAGDYFQGVPVELVAIPAPGYVFSHWLGDYSTTRPQLQIDLSAPVSLTPYFRPSQAEDEPIIINEINYHSSDDFDTGDWIELYNPAPHFVNLSGWELKDERDDRSFVFPEGSLIGGEGFLVVVRSSRKFKQYYPELKEVTGELGFGLSSAGDVLRLYDRQGVLRDEVAYLPEAPWPPEANGLGPTLELKNPSLDNALPQNWASLHGFGSPGRPNAESPTTIDPLAPNISALHLYPNPSGGKVNLTFELKEPSRISATFMDLRGGQVMNIFEGELQSGTHHLIANLSHLSSGLYLLRFRDDKGYVKVIKWARMP
ncbi:MAG: T9SS C-terminal target domain-containing protein, partial [Bacteroidetes bacterium]